MVSGLLLIDFDGTFIPGTELRNRAVIQSIVDDFSAQADKSGFLIPWDICNGRAEPDIHKILMNNGFQELGDFITPNDFESRAREGYDQRTPDYSPRTEIIETLCRAKESLDVVSVLVSNSINPQVFHGLSESFATSAKNIEDVLPIIVTKTEVVAAGKMPKPSGDPFDLGHQLAEEKFGDIPLRNVMIVEDSATGVEAGYNYTGNREQIIQFTDMAPPHKHAGHCVQTMADCYQAVASRFKKDKESIVSRLKDGAGEMIKHSDIDIAYGLRR